ncbi:SRPBCC family protein [Rhodococcus triatomae]|uniref:Polyketide cyclase / dehydrase and lipid transport n=1 Tax=Rhodococcus triatomae TaxID=300028 RepID=A0A1G8GBF5_9NOCA|nr:SRPBCC family protein [Rhodococcus triatomae]QNG20432.1 SRPBCC family protein [Rhodococcus triatomae]QNG23652.1 SRPBCC family protein [Rhodococcus triatomae]SDH91742.1 Polyketide cyclase / dehydrase and lipid transport [Rhodococcus triatomae]
MIHIRHSASAAAPIEVVFAYIDDHSTVPDWMFGVSQFTPVGEFTQGLGAQFDAVMKIGPASLESRLEVTEWVENEVITLSSLGGVSNSSSWRFIRKGDSATELSVDFAYQLPGGLAGKALGRIVEPFVGTAIKNTEETLRRNVEEIYAREA